MSLAGPCRFIWRPRAPRWCTWPSSACMPGPCAVWTAPFMKPNKLRKNSHERTTHFLCPFVALLFAVFRRLRPLPAGPERAGAGRHAALVDRLSVHDRHHHPVRHHRRHQPHLERDGILCGGAQGASHVQWHGHGRRLDLGSQLHQPGRWLVPERFRWPGLHHGLDRRLLPGGPADRALSAQVRPVHNTRLPGGPLRQRCRRARRTRAGGGRGRHHHRFIHVCGGADLRCGPDRFAVYGRGLFGRYFPGTGQHPGLFFPRRHACHHVDAGSAIHHHPGGFLIPAMWLSVKHGDNPVPQLAYGKVLPQLSAREHVLENDPKEQEVRDIFAQRAKNYQARLERLPESWEQGRLAAQRQLDELRLKNASLLDIRNAERYLLAYPKNADEARVLWQTAQAMNQKRSEPITPHAQPFPAPDREQSDIKRNNFLALVFCMMLGTAALPHILMRSYTTPSVHETRVSVFWTLFFILLIYLTIPALAVLVKYDIYSALVGTQYANLPTWVSYWANVDKLNPLISIVDVNRDGIVQLAEIAIDADVLVLATPEIAGLPYVISGLVAAGGLAAALSTADGLLLAISNALSHDIYYKVVDPSASTQKRVTISKLLLLAVAFIAAYAASQKPADILSLVGVAFSLAASTLFPVLVLGVFWKRANHYGALAGMLTGFGVCLYYMVHTSNMLGGSAAEQWFHIAPISAGIFGVPAGLTATVLVSWLTPKPGRRSTGLVEHIRAPETPQ